MRYFRLCIFLSSIALAPLQGLAQVPADTDRTARNLGIDLEIVGDDHPELPNLEDGNMRHGSFFVYFKDGGINVARLERVPMLRQVFVFHRSWTDEAPMDDRAIGCPANAYSNLEDPIACFRAILEKMEGGRGPVMLQVRFYGRGRVVATFHLNSVQIPWAYVKHYAKMEQTPRRR